MIRTLLLSTAVSLSAPLAMAQSEPQIPQPLIQEPHFAEPDLSVESLMTPGAVNGILLALDPEAVVGPTGVQMTIDDVPVTVLYSPAADRIRALVPIASVANSTPQQLVRLMQANFDTALDARYAIADGRIWSVFMHPMAEMDADRLISGVAQTVSLAQTFGTTYASTETMFMRGDSIDEMVAPEEPDTQL